MVLKVISLRVEPVKYAVFDTVAKCLYSSTFDFEKDAEEHITDIIRWNEE